MRSVLVRPRTGHTWLVTPILLAGSVALTGGCTTDRPQVREEAPPPDQQNLGGEDLATPAEVTVFDEVHDPQLQGRLTVHVLAQEVPTRERLSRRMRELLPARAQLDPKLVAIRAVVYYPVLAGGAAEGDLAPVAWAEWIPLEGWAGDVGEGRGTNHRVYFYFGTPPEW